MGYRLLSEQEAATLPHYHGALGLDVSRAQQIVDAEVTFDIMAITGVTAGSPADKAGLHRGDQIIAVNSRVFSSLRSFAAYVGSMEEGNVASIDYMPPVAAQHGPNVSPLPWGTQLSDPPAARRRVAYPPGLSSPSARAQSLCSAATNSAVSRITKSSRSEGDLPTACP